MKTIKVEAFKEKIEKNCKEVAESTAMEIAKRAKKIAMKEMLKKKHGRLERRGFGSRIYFNEDGSTKRKIVSHGQYRRSAIGETIGREPSWLRNQYADVRRRQTTYDNIEANAQHIKNEKKGPGKSYSYAAVLKDKTYRGKYKHDYNINEKGKGIALIDLRNLNGSLDKNGLIKNGRSLFSYALVQAYYDLKDDLPRNAVKILRRF